MSGGQYGRGKAPERECMKLVQWPKKDRELWTSALTAGDLFDEGGARANHRPDSNRSTEKGYGRWLTFLRIRGDLDPHVPPTDRITPEQVRAYIAALQDLGNGSQTVLGRLQTLGDMAALFAPERDWGFINRVASKIRARHVPARDKRVGLQLSDALFGLGLDLMEQAASANTPRRRATLYRDGLLIAFEALVPLRRKNLAQFRLSVSLIKIGPNWIIAFPGEDMKNHDPRDDVWPDILVPHLEHYLAAHRPFLAGCTGRWTSDPEDALWLSTDGSALTQMAIYDRIRKHTEQAFGTAMNPHRFRDAAATTLAIAAPAHVRAAAAILGHRDLSTSQKTYQQKETLKAHKQYADEVAKRRRKHRR